MQLWSTNWKAQCALPPSIGAAGDPWVMQHMPRHGRGWTAPQGAELRCCCRTAQHVHVHVHVHGALSAWRVQGVALNGSMCTCAACKAHVSPQQPCSA